MLDLAAIPVKLGEPKRLGSLAFGMGSLIAGVMVKKQKAKFVLFGIGLVAISMTLAGYLNPVTVGSGLGPNGAAGSQYKAIPAWYGKYTSTNTRANKVPYEPVAWEKRYEAGSASDIGKGRVQPVFNTAYGAEAVIPAGPATNAQAAVQWLGAEPNKLRYVTGVENEGLVIGQGG